MQVFKQVAFVAAGLSLFMLLPQQIEVHGQGRGRGQAPPGYVDAQAEFVRRLNTPKK